MKKLFTLIVAICATTLAWADDSGSCGSNVTFTYVESTGTLTISGTGAMTDYKNPSQVPWLYLSIKKVVINNGVTSIGEQAFRYCSGLTSINVAEDNLNYTSIDGVLYSKDKKTLITCPNGRTGSITIPNSVTSIGEEAFLACTGLTSITIPNSVTSIGKLAFSDCTGLTSVTIPNSVTSIGDMAFYYCTGLTSITIPNSVTSIGDGAFSSCYRLTSVTIPNSVTSIGKSAFSYCSGLTSVTIPNSVTSIAEEAFYDCIGLTSVTIPNSVTSIGEQAFRYCSGLTSINVAEDNLNYTSIDGVLYSKDKKTLITCPGGKTGSITIPNSVTSIGDEAFYDCTGLTSITIPNSVTSIGGYAFYYCTGLTSMTVEATKPPLCDYLGTLFIPLYVPAGSVDAYKTAYIWKDFTPIGAIPATGVKEATAEKREVKKIIDRNGIIYIEKDGTRYFLNGDKVE